MTQQPIELILLKQAASHLATPIFLVSPDGDLVFYNEPAEEILGRRYDEMGEMSLAVWSTLFRPATANGEPLGPEGLPLVVALSERRPVHGGFDIIGLDGAATIVVGHRDPADRAGRPLPRRARAVLGG